MASKQSEQHGENLKSWLDSWVASGTLPGAVLGIYDSSGKEIFHHCVDNSSFSFVNPSLKNVYDRDSIFRIYSMTKPVTTVAALILMERGVLSLDDPVSKWIPCFSKTKVFEGGTVDAPLLAECIQPLSIRHLMSQTSGITYGIFANHPSDQILRAKVGADSANWYCHTSLSELCEHIAETPLCFQPGTKFLYGLNTDVLGHVVEKASGGTLQEFFFKEIFEPLGMVDTDFYVPEAKLHRLVKCFEVGGGHHYKESTSIERNRHEVRALQGGGGGLVSTLGDFTKFALCLLNKGEYEDRTGSGKKHIISEATLSLMTTNQLPGNANLVDVSFDSGAGFTEMVGDGLAFGLGVSLLTEPSKVRGGELSDVGEYGWGGVASTVFLVNPASKTTTVFLTQVIPSSAYPFRTQLRWMVNRFVKSTQAGAQA